MQHITDKGREERHESPDREVERHVELAELGTRPTAESEIRRRQHGHDGKGRKRGIDRRTGQNEPPLLPIAQRVEQSEAERPDGSKHRGVGEQAKQQPWPEALLGAARLQRRKAEAEQHPEGVAPADHEIFPEQVIAEEEKQLPHWPEGR
jgi:hypothetical protein